LSLAFKGAGYAVTTAENCHDAISRCREETFDIVLSDVVMPGVNGHDLVRWIAAHCPGTRTALMSGFDASADGADRSPCPFIKKPFLPGEIVAFVRQLLVS
jgi:two-component system cell cycle response regulator CpdR